MPQEHPDPTGEPVGLICSSGGHLLELYQLRKAWSPYDRFWVTFYTSDTASLLSQERVYPAHHPTTRNLRNLLRNLRLAWKILRKERPAALISTGAAISVSFFVMARFFRIRTIYIESLSRIDTLSLTGKILYFLADDFFVQWPELTKRYNRAVYKGQVL
jgi:beta-1,4-N-acetylglucosaminyltransferase